ncbi:HB1 protein [Chlamydia pneumoniae TW-183]|nr:DUF1978 domain-containing protein [Chlamydia pneumoniae]AAP97941.1 HB1 protein [Chlamydia pneumoniae TW-183]CRI35360.1 HB1 protein [Chlamydia pneumoniae]CRI41007.1 HB1 protein [Chlamydia pneumoniae]CRI51153.1 HB1 protein [Chlamydia pneumoniae]
MRKLRILAIVLIALSIILIAGGVVLLTVAIPGLSSVISSPAGMGACALGCVMLALGIDVLLKKREVPIVLASVTTTPGTGSPRSGISISGADSTIRSLPTYLLDEGHPQSMRKLRILAIVLIVFSIILIASGVVLLTVAIPGLSSVISSPAGMGACALGCVMLALGIDVLLKKREVPIVLASVTTTPGTGSPRSGISISGADSTIRSLPTYPLDEGHPQSMRKLRILAIVLIVFSIILIASGVVLLTVAIPGLSSIISSPAEMGACALGCVMLALGIDVLLKKREVPIVVPAPIPEEVVIDDIDEESIRLQQEAEAALARLPEEMSAFEGYIKVVESHLENMKSLPYDGHGLEEKTKHQIRVVRSSLKAMVPEFLDIRRIFEEEEFFFLSARKRLIDLATTLVERKILTEQLERNNLRKAFSYLYQDSIFKKIIDNFEKLAWKFMILSKSICRFTIIFENHEHGVAKSLLHKNAVLLEKVIYRSLQKSYRDIGMSSAKMKILHGNPFFSLEDNKKTIMKEHAEMLESLSSYRKVFLALSDENVVDTPSDPKKWDLSGIPCRDALSEISRDEQWQKKAHLKHQESLYTQARDRLTDQSSKENQKELEKAEQEYISSWERVKKFEIERVQERIQAIQKLYPNILEREEETTGQETVTPTVQGTTASSDLTDILGRIEVSSREDNQNQESCVKVLRSHEVEMSWEVKQEYGPKKKEFQDQMGSLERFFTEHIEELEVLQKDYSKHLSYFKKVNNKKEVQYAKFRLKVLESDLEGILAQTESAESLLTQEELPILATRGALEKAVFKGSLCCALASKAKPYFEEDPRFQDSDTQLRALTLRLQEAKASLEEEIKRFSNLENDIAEERRLLKESKQTFERAGLGVLREIAVESTYDLRSLTNTWEGTPESEKVYFSMYLNYYNEEKRRAKTRLVEMTQRYRDFKMALEAMQFNEEALLQEELSIQAPSE